MGNGAAAAEVADLRHHRRELRRELARVRWWRRLIANRRELTVARLAGATEADETLDTTWEALAADAPTAGELAEALWPSEEPPTARSIDILDDFDARLGSYERRLSANLEGVTADMIDAMGAAR